MVSTGGSNGTPKSAVFTNENIIQATVQVKMIGVFPEEARWYDIMPPCIAYGLADGSILGFYQVVRANKILESLKRPDDFDKERFFGQDEDRVVLNFGYGSTEVTGCASVGPCNKDVKLATVGLTLPYQVVSAFDFDESTVEYIELKYIANNELDNVPQHKIGELCIEGPNIMLGYLNDPEETAKAIRTHSDVKRWVHMGDLGFVDEDGYVHFVDRMKYISVGHDGFKVAPLEIEEVILKNEAIDQCNAVIFDDPEQERGNVIKAYYTLKKDAAISDIVAFEDTLNEFCASELADYKCPVGYKLLKGDNNPPCTLLESRQTRFSLETICSSVPGYVK